MDNKFNTQDVIDLLPTYYKMLFPSNLFIKWLSYSDDKNKNSLSPTNDPNIKNETGQSKEEEAWQIKQKQLEIENSYIARREFSFTLPGDIFVRYKSFISASELTTALQRDVPIKFDIGAVFSQNPKYAKKARDNAIVPVERELVFDIDMDDYNEVRSCCQGASVCSKCWQFMAIAAKLLDMNLRHDFGFKHILWVFSGRRGIHCWVCDERARKLTHDARSAIVTYLSYIEGGAHKSKRVNLPKLLHPMVVKSVELIEPYFGKILEEQKILDSEEKVKAFFKYFNNTNVQKLLMDYGKRAQFWSKSTAIEKYNQMAKIAAAHFDKNKNDLGRHYDQEIKLQFCYPRLDVNVSKGLNHLLKAPFCVHPKTGRVCVPFEIESVDSFDPSNVPTITQVLNEMTQIDKNDGDTPTKSAYEKTSLKPSIKLFTKFVNNLRLDRSAQAQKTSAKSLDF